MKEKIKYTFSDFILHTLKKFEFKFYHSTEGHTFLFWPCYVRYILLIIDKLPVEFSLLMPLLHLPLETAHRFIHPRHFFIIFFIQVLPEIVVNFIKRIYFVSYFISFHYTHLMNLTMLLKN